MKQRLDIENIEEVEYITKVHADYIGQLKKDSECMNDEDFEEYTQCIY